MFLLVLNFLFVFFFFFFKKKQFLFSPYSVCSSDICTRVCFAMQICLSEAQSLRERARNRERERSNMFPYEYTFLCACLCVYYCCTNLCFFIVCLFLFSFIFLIRFHSGHCRSVEYFYCNTRRMIDILI